MKKFREDKIQGILATFQLLSKLEKVMGIWTELHNEEMSGTWQHTWWTREMYTGFWKENLEESNPRTGPEGSRG
jgi:hypothetical protein